jgi:hypothetical protein
VCQRRWNGGPAQLEAALDNWARARPSRRASTRARHRRAASRTPSATSGSVRAAPAPGRRWRPLASQRSWTLGTGSPRPRRKSPGAGPGSPHLRPPSSSDGRGAKVLLVVAEAAPGRRVAISFFRPGPDVGRSLRSTSCCSWCPVVLKRPGLHDCPGHWVPASGRCFADLGRQDGSCHAETVNARY